MIMLMLMSCVKGIGVMSITNQRIMTVNEGSLMKGVYLLFVLRKVTQNQFVDTF